MRPYNEADTRAKLIDPKLKLAGWGESQIEREHYFVKGRAITNGRIYLVGEESRRREPRRVDYLLRYNGQMIAVIEAKDETHRWMRDWNKPKPMPECSTCRLHMPAMATASWSLTFS